MDIFYSAYITSENITKDIKSRIEKFLPLAEKFFAERNLPVTDENLKVFQEFCIAEKIGAESTVKNGISALRKYYKWKGENSMNENIISDNNIVEDIKSEQVKENIIGDNIISETHEAIDENNTNGNIIADNNTNVNAKAKAEMKKISVNIEKKKYQQLQCLAIKYDKNFTDYIILAIDKLLEEYKSDLSNITGIF